MASCNFRKSAASANSVRQNVHNWLCCLTILVLLTLMKEAYCATTSVLHNKSGRDLVLSIPQEHLHIEVPAGQSIKLEGSQQRRGVVIQDVQSGALAGPMNLPDSPSLEAVQLDPSSFTASTVDVSITVIAGTSAGVSKPGGTSSGINRPGGPS